MRAKQIGVLIVASALLLAVCGAVHFESEAYGDGEAKVVNTGVRCSINADCNGGAYCLEGACVRDAAECTADADCGAGAVCTHDRLCYSIVASGR